jgi:nucleoside 2-deoxyribosyltransferase
MAKVFISAALFTYAERHYNALLRDHLVVAGHDVVLPQEFDESGGEENLFQQCIDGIRSSDVVVAVLEGAEVDVGVGFEVGVAYTNGIPVLGLRTDFRRRSETVEGGLNLMLQYGINKVIYSAGEPFEGIVDAVGRVMDSLPAK